MKIRQLSDSQYTENDKVSLWEWSKGFSPAQNDQMTIAIMIREAQDETQYRQGSTGLHELVQPQVKVIRVTKKLLNNTVFVIFEDESPHFPMYRIVNSCRNVRIQLQQANMDEPKGSPEVIEFDQSMIFGLYEPENERKVKLDLEIDKNDFSSNTMYRKGEVVVQEQLVDLTEICNRKEWSIEFQDINGRTRYLALSLQNDGQTKTICLKPDREDQSSNDDQVSDGRFASRSADQLHLQSSQVEENYLKKQGDEADRKKLK